MYVGGECCIYYIRGVIYVDRRRMRIVNAFRAFGASYGGAVCVFDPRDGDTVKRRNC